MGVEADAAGIVNKRGSSGYGGRCSRVRRNCMCVNHCSEMCDRYSETVLASLSLLPPAGEVILKKGACACLLYMLCLETEEEHGKQGVLEMFFCGAGS